MRLLCLEVFCYVMAQLVAIPERWYLRRRIEVTHAWNVSTPYLPLPMIHLVRYNSLVCVCFRRFDLYTKASFKHFVRCVSGVNFMSSQEYCEGVWKQFDELRMQVTLTFWSCSYMEKDMRWSHIIWGMGLWWELEWVFVCRNYDYGR